MAKKFTATEVKQLDVFAAAFISTQQAHRDEAVMRARISDAYRYAELMLEESKFYANKEQPPV